MRNLLKYVGISLLVVGLAACDGKSDTIAAGDNGGAQTSQGGETIALMGGKLSFTLPAGMTDKSDKISTQATNRHVYADESGQKAVIVIEGADSKDSLDDLAKRLITQQQSYSPQLQIVTNRTMTVDEQPLQRLDTVINANGQSVWSSLILGKINNKLLTLQITLPGDDQQAAQTEAENILQTLRLQ